MSKSKRTLIGYSSELSLRPGETVDFMVNALNGETYQADLVKVINGDNLSCYADQFEVRPVESAFSGQYQGHSQALNPGSYVHIDELPALDKVAGFTVACWIYPCFDPSTYEPPDLDNIDPFNPPSLNIAASISDQVIVSRYDNISGNGWSLQINKDFQLIFVLANEGSKQVVCIDESLRAWDWAYVAVAYDAGDGTLTLFLREKPWASGDQLTARNLSTSAKVETPIQAGPLRIAALRDGVGAACSSLEKPGMVFNGRIQDVRITSRALDADELDLLSSELTPDTLQDSIIADWDFGFDIQTDRIRDISTNSSDGVLINAPDRAVRGVFWDGSTVRWIDRPDLYDAITFHADDLYDAQWAPDFSFTVADNLPSGIYAARLTQRGFTEYITFFVAAPKNKPSAKLALWLSVFDYMAYSNVSIAATAAGNYPGHNFNQDDIEFLKSNPEYATGGVYNMHLDGLYYSWGSRKRPDLQMKPGAMVYNFVQDTHISAFLENEGIAYDIITDEQVAKEGIELLSQYTLVISSSHHEYVTTDQFDAIDHYTANGGRFFSIGGNGWFWSVAPLPAYPGTMESRNFHEIGERFLVNGNPGGLMVENGRKTGPVFGNEMSAMVFNGSSAYGKLDDADDSRVSWIFEDTGEGRMFGDYGIDRVHGGAAGFEIDRYNPDNGVPRHALHLASSEPLRPTIENVQLGNLPLAISYDPCPEENWAQADLVFFETPDGGAMFSTGSINWISSTLENGFNNDVAQITRNVIGRFLDPAPFPHPTTMDVHEVDRTGMKAVHEHADKI